MKTPVPSPRSLSDLRELTPARVGLGRAGASMPTKALLEFTLDHARARDAVHAVFDVFSLISGLGGLGLRPVQVSSQARDRKEDLRRPDLGRILDPPSKHLVANRDGGPCQLAVVVRPWPAPSPVDAHAVQPG